MALSFVLPMVPDSLWSELSPSRLTSERRRTGTSVLRFSHWRRVCARQKSRQDRWNFGRVIRAGTRGTPLNGHGQGGRFTVNDVTTGTGEILNGLRHSNAEPVLCSRQGTAAGTWRAVSGILGHHSANLPSLYASLIAGIAICTASAATDEGEEFSLSPSAYCTM